MHQHQQGFVVFISVGVAYTTRSCFILSMGLSVNAEDLVGMAAFATPRMT